MDLWRGQGEFLNPFCKGKRNFPGQGASFMEGPGGTFRNGSP